MDGLMDGWIDGWVDGWIDRWIDGLGENENENLVLFLPFGDLGVERRFCSTGGRGGR